MRLLVDRNIPYIAGVLEPFAEVEYFDDRPAAADADALVIRTRTKCDAELLDGSNVKLIATATIGTDHIDTDYCRANKIEVISAAGCNAAAVMQWVAAALVELDVEPSKTTLGIVGVGNVGSLVKSYAESWGFKVLCNDIIPSRSSASLSQIVNRADIITFHVPLNRSTRGIIDAAMAQHIAGRRAIILNTSRGEIADEEALGRYRTRYGADVWSGEPLINPNSIDRALIATPHIAGYSAQGKANATAAVVKALAHKFNLPLLDWYPPQITPIRRRPIRWTNLKATIPLYLNIARLTAQLKANPTQFETLRNCYPLRQEYF